MKNSTLIANHGHERAAELQHYLCSTLPQLEDEKYHLETLCVEYVLNEMSDTHITAEELTLVYALIEEKENALA